MGQNQEYQNFELDPAILWDIIRSQAGTRDKALLEIVMNSVDAGATRVDITLNERGFGATDDGKGFADKDEILRFFKRFGTPHKQGDAKFGRYRMGRGQIMSFSLNSWRSSTFRMDVNIKEGLGFMLHENLPFQTGCVIEGQWYDKLRPSDFLVLKQGLEQLCQYIPIPVYLNGERISVEMDKEKWTLVDDDAYYRLRLDGNSLTVYNQGALVRAYPSGQFGVGGVVVSKGQLQVNFARNDILLQECEVWKRVAAKLRAYARERQEKKPVMDEPYRTSRAYALTSADFPNAIEFAQAVDGDKVLTDITGKHLSFGELVSRVSKSANKLVMSPQAGSVIADKVHKSGLAVVLSPKTLERFGARTLPDLLKRVIDAGTARFNAPHLVGNVQFALAAYQEFEFVAASLSENYEPVEDKALSAKELIVLRAIREGHESMFWQLRSRFHGKKLRQIRIGESDTAAAWYTGADVIFLNRENLSLPGHKGALVPHLTKVGAYLIHENLHDTQSAAAHTHGEEFMMEFHELVVSGALGTFVNRAMDAYLVLKVKEAKKTTLGDRKEMDRQAALEGDLPEETSITEGSLLPL
ncbi:ATP-binding protein [Paraburkholderia sp. UCT31]|uniref:ATP-binding protein n=1 Tax=Paraburkholderia sp. UCT31 TaxID=2615209 RepID=UPI0016560038|nr:ATP-binding protein [Paraburkholderia sp. UCT31]MBC8739744.1 ATP-binding protein [Paraburkholderia sp. UCT31]